jgi:hypothetical protein
LLIAATALAIATTVVVRASRFEWELQRHRPHRFGISPNRHIHPTHIARIMNVLLPFADLVQGGPVIGAPAYLPTSETSRRLALRTRRFGRRLDGGAAR